mmetsp:Transcript_51274/g.143367  ORF Transcript_51274/g.143367 Transcript_51274/m.143367 type:complete len:80 (+) Transcript_51274:58-297(+)
MRLEADCPTSVRKNISNTPELTAASAANEYVPRPEDEPPLPLQRESHKSEKFLEPSVAAMASRNMPTGRMPPAADAYAK